MPKSPGLDAAHSPKASPRKKKTGNTTSRLHQDQDPASSAKGGRIQDSNKTGPGLMVCSPRSRRSPRNRPADSISDGGRLERRTPASVAKGGRIQYSSKPIPGVMVCSPRLRRSPRIRPADSNGGQGQHEGRTPASVGKAAQPAAASPKPKPCSVAARSSDAAAKGDKGRSSKTPTRVASSAGKAPALRKSPGRSPLRRTNAATPAAALKSVATPAAAATSAGVSTMKTHQRRRNSAASKILTSTVLLQQGDSTQNTAAGAQSAPAAVGGKRKARSQAVELSPSQAGAKKKRRVTMPAAPVTVHADPEEIQYWKEVEAEELIVEPADSEGQEEDQ